MFYDQKMNLLVYSIFIDCVMLVHFSWALFNLFGFFLVRKFPKVKLFHVGTLTITALLMITGNVCPLTSWEQWFKQKADLSNTVQEGFLSYYLGHVLYINVPPWIITTITIVLTLTAIWFYFILPWIHSRKS
jgi:hypothetical protein